MRCHMTEVVEAGRYAGLPRIGSPFLTREGDVEGKVVGYQHCRMEGCYAQRIGVRWPNNRLTWPCSKGCWITENGTWGII